MGQDGQLGGMIVQICGAYIVLIVAGGKTHLPRHLQCLCQSCRRARAIRHTGLRVFPHAADAHQAAYRIHQLLPVSCKIFLDLFLIFHCAKHSFALWLGAHRRPLCTLMVCSKAAAEPNWLISSHPPKGHRMIALQLLYHIAKIKWEDFCHFRSFSPWHTTKNRSALFGKAVIHLFTKGARSDRATLFTGISW